MAEGLEHLKMPQSYRGTTVPAHRTVAGIEQLLQEFGAQAIGVNTIRQGKRKIARFCPWQSSWLVAVWPELDCRGTLMVVEISPELEAEFLETGWLVMKQDRALALGGGAN